MTDDSFGSTIERPQPRQAWYSKWWGIVIIVVGVLLLAMIVASTLYIAQVRDRLQNRELNFQNGGGLSNTAMNDIVSDDDPAIGPIDAPITIVEFSDFQCPYCAQAAPVVQEIINRYGDQVRFVFRDFPLEDIHPDSVTAALAAACAHEQGKFWEYHDILFENQSALSVADLKRYGVRVGVNSIEFNTCLDNGTYFSEVQNDFTDGLAAGVTATPTFFVNGTVLKGVPSVGMFEQIIATYTSIP